MGSGDTERDKAEGGRIPPSLKEGCWAGGNIAGVPGLIPFLQEPEEGGVWGEPKGDLRKVGGGLGTLEGNGLGLQSLSASTCT